MKNILFCLLIISTLISCSKGGDTSKDAEKSSNTYFLKLSIGDKKYEINEIQSTGNCFELIGHNNAPYAIFSATVHSASACMEPNRKDFNLFIDLKTPKAVGTHLIKWGVNNGNGFSFYVDEVDGDGEADSFYAGNGGATGQQEEATQSNLEFVITKAENKGGVIEGTIKGTATKYINRRGDETFSKLVTVDGSFRVLSD